MTGRKVRAAHSRADGACDYSSRKRRNGIELVMECADCEFEPGLQNPRCFRSVMHAIQSEGLPVAVTMRSHIERRYGQSAAGTMGQISDILNRVQSLQSQLARDSTRNEACAGCVSQLSTKLTAISRGLNAMDLNNAISSAKTLESQNFGSSRSSCADCKGMTIVQVNDISKAARTMESTIVKGAFNIVEAE
ncbi:MAG: hypothetical protein Q7J68_07285 [Thermoplasmata archaeon]|nr:hypothetical protein [Thermoplasmata archaeon]